MGLGFHYETVPGTSGHLTNWQEPVKLADMPPRKKSTGGLRWDAVQAKGARRKLLAVYLGLGYSKPDAAAKVGMTLNGVDTACSDPAFVAMVDRISLQHAETMEVLLSNAETKAIETLTNLLDAEDEDIRYKAAVNLLDRAGKRGAVVTRVEQKTVQHTTEVKGDLNEALSKALLDPGVRRWLSAQPGFENAINSSGVLRLVAEGPAVQRADGGPETVVIPESDDIESGGDILDSGDEGSSGVDEHPHEDDLPE